MQQGYDKTISTTGKKSAGIYFLDRTQPIITAKIIVWEIKRSLIEDFKTSDSFFPLFLLHFWGKPLFKL